MKEYEITRDGHTFTVQLDEETARAWGLIDSVREKGTKAEEHATAPKAETRTRKPKAS